MNSRDVFGIIIRTFGLCLVLYAVWFFFSATVIHFNLTKAGETEAFEFFAVGTLFWELACIFFVVRRRSWDSVIPSRKLAKTARRRPESMARVKVTAPASHKKPIRSGIFQTMS